MIVQLTKVELQRGRMLTTGEVVKKLSSLTSSVALGNVHLYSTSLEL